MFLAGFMFSNTRLRGNLLEKSSLKAAEQLP